MSWHLEICGTPSDVNAAIDECVANAYGMPPVVGSYLKDAVAAVKAGDSSLVYVKSNGHRPMESAGSNETSEVKLIRAKPYNPPVPPVGVGG